MRTRASSVVTIGLTLAGACWALPACNNGRVLFSETGTTGNGGSSPHAASGVGTGTESSTGDGATGGAEPTSTGPSMAIGSTGVGGAVPATTDATSGTAVSSASSSSSAASGGGPYPATFPEPPQVITFGGPVLANPKVYPVFFAQDATNTAFVSALTDFSQKITTSAYFATATAEYGVGPGTGEPAIQLTEMAPTTIDDTAIQTWLSTKFAAGAPFPTPDADTLIVLYYPAGTTITLQGNSSCSTFGGYHNGAVLSNNQEIAYAVVPRCDATVTTATSAGSHEIVEASTDPYPMDNPAYAQVDDADLYWQLVIGGGEVGDMCESFPNVFQTFPPFDYTVQRIWSNKAAKEGRDPCQPELPGEVYVGAAPVLGMVPLSLMGQTAMVHGVSIPVGGTKTIPIDLFSQGPVTGPFTVSAIDPGPMLGAGTLLNLTVTPPTGINGNVATLTIDVLKAGQGNAELFYITAQSPGMQAQGVWFGLVGN